MAEESTRARRPQRIPISTRKILRYPERKGYHRRVVNDTEGRINMFKDAGWTVVEGALNGSDPKVGDPSKLGSAVSKHVGGGVVGVLMEIPDEFYIADQDAKEAKRRKTEAAMNEWKNQPGNYGEIKNK